MSTRTPHFSILLTQHLKAVTKLILVPTPGVTGVPGVVGVPGEFGGIVELGDKGT